MTNLGSSTFSSATGSRPVVSGRLLLLAAFVALAALL
jgi:hypothetical protein